MKDPEAHEVKPPKGCSARRARGDEVKGDALLLSSEDRKPERPKAQESIRPRPKLNLWEALRGTAFTVGINR
jgi:hypothetical protein